MNLISKEIRLHVIARFSGPWQVIGYGDQFSKWILHKLRTYLIVPANN